MNQGTLKRFNPDKGYGYITPDEGNEEIFFSYSATWVADSGSSREGLESYLQVGRGLARPAGRDRLQGLGSRGHAKGQVVRTPAFSCTELL